MFKKKPKANKVEAPADAAAPKAKRSKLKLALFVTAPLLVLAGGAYAGWAMFLTPEAAVADEEADHGIDPQKVAALALESAAETSATYSFALAELTRNHCGEVNVPALKAASEAEGEHNAKLVSLSWIAANRRLASMTEKSCGRVQSEIYSAEVKARSATEGDKGKEKGGGHH